MNNLKVVNQNGALLVSSVEVAEMVGMQHKNLLRLINNYAGVLTGSKLSPLDFFIESTYEDKKGQLRPCWLLTKKGCDMVANKLTGEKGILFTAQYVDTFDRMEQELKKQQTPKIPTTYKEALLELIAKEEENERLLLEAKKNEPLLSFAKMCSESEDSLLIREFAKLCKNNGIDIGEKRLFAKLREWNLIFKKKNEPMQKYIDSGLFTLSQKSVIVKGSVKMFVTMRVTPKGQQYILNKLENEGKEKAVLLGN
jgi:Rha family phage regulatory protein